MKVKRLKELIKNVDDDLNVYVAEYGRGEWSSLPEKDLKFSEENPEW